MGLVMAERQLQSVCTALACKWTGVWQDGPGHSGDNSPRVIFVVVVVVWLEQCATGSDHDGWNHDEVMMFFSPGSGSLPSYTLSK